MQTTVCSTTTPKFYALSVNAGIIVCMCAPVGACGCLCALWVPVCVSVCEEASTLPFCLEEMIPQAMHTKGICFAWLG